MVSANSSGDEAIAHFVKKAIDFGATEIEVAGLRAERCFSVLLGAMKFEVVGPIRGMEVIASGT